MRSPSSGLTLLDLKLPKLTGLEVLELYFPFPRTALLPVVVLTSSSEDDIVASYRLGASLATCASPWRSKPVVEAVGRLGIYWLMR